MKDNKININTNGEAIMGYIDNIRSVGKEMLTERDKFTKDRIIGSLEIIMSASIGFLGFVSTGIILQKDITNDSLILFSFFYIVAIITFVFSFVVRSQIISRNEESYAKKGNICLKYDNLIESDFDELIQMLPKDLYARLAVYKQNELAEVMLVKKKLNESTFLTCLHNFCYILFAIEMLFLLSSLVSVVQSHNLNNLTTDNVIEETLYGE